MRVENTVWDDQPTYPVSEDCERQPGASDHLCPARRCRSQHLTGSHWQWQDLSPPGSLCRPSSHAWPRPPPRPSAPGSRASRSRPRGQGWRPGWWMRNIRDLRGGKGGGYKVKTDGFLGISANESYFKLQQFFINVKLEWRKMLVGGGDGNIYQIDPVTGLTDIIVEEYLISIIYWVATITALELRLSLSRARHSKLIMV